MNRKNTEEQKKYEYWLYQTFPLKRYRMIQMTERGISPRELYEMKDTELEKLWKSICQNGKDAVTEKDIALLLESRHTFDLQREYELLREKGIEFISILHDDYPQKLRDIPDPPFAFFRKGATLDDDCMQQIKKAPTIAIIGARNCSGYGRDMAMQIGRKSADLGMTVVSGLAAGIDGIAQEAAHRAGGYVQAVLGSGVDVCYPAKNRAVYDAVLQRGEIISEYLPGTLPMACNFPPRNRIISGFCDALIVVEARQRSGTSITVNMALEQGKDVFAIPGRITDPMSLGCNQMISQGAGIITDIEEGLLEIRQIILDRGQNIQTLHNKTTAIEQMENSNRSNLAMYRQSAIYEEDSLKGHLYACIDYMPKTMQQLYEESGSQNIAEVMTALLQMELDGAIVEKGGAYSL